MGIRDLEPKKIWEYFYEITQIPRPSKHEGLIIEYLINFARKRKLEYKKDKAGNVLIVKPASKGLEQQSPVILQSHLDMVCEKNTDTVHDFLNDPIQAYIDGEWIKAKGTTLGADDGIGIAAMLAILDDDTILHGPLECLFTVDEETGLTGAFELEAGFINGKVLINLDSEDEGEIFIGCAGGRDTIATFPVKYSPAVNGNKSYIFSITGLKGGHSGDDIHKGLGNAIKIMAEFLIHLEKHLKIGLHRFEGGNLRNAIPRESFASISVNILEENALMNIYQQFKNDLLIKWLPIEPAIKFNIEPIDIIIKCIDDKLKNQLLQSIIELPNGVIAWHKEMDNLVETSTNLASIKFTPENTIEITTSQRSSSDVEKQKIVQEVSRIFGKYDAEITHSKGYPGWTPKMDSPILKKTVGNYEKLFHTKPKVKAIHAGLECGLFLEKYPDWDMISIGPTLRGVHSPDERLNIASVKKFWELLISVI